MKPLATPWWQWRGGQTGMPALNAVVVGSGYGGAVAALRLAEKGWQVTLFERGGEYRPGDFPNDAATAPKHFRAPSADGRSVAGRPTGLYEIRAGPGMIALAGNGLGGGSLVNAGVLLEPEDEVMAQQAWPVEVRCEERARRQRWFAQARAMLRAHDSAGMASRPRWTRSAASRLRRAARCRLSSRPPAARSRPRPACCASRRDRCACW